VQGTAAAITVLARLDKKEDRHSSNAALMPSAAGRDKFLA
jgi:hypothetical protein